MDIYNNQLANKVKEIDHTVCAELEQVNIYLDLQGQEE